MAYTREKRVTAGEGLDVFVENSLKMYSRQIYARNAEDESKFNTMVLEENMSLGDQLNYRNEQLKRVADDPEERKRIRTEISNLKDRIEQKTFNDKYLEQLIDFESGVTSVDSVIDWLTDYKNSTTDESVKSKIQEQLVTKQGEKYKLTQQMLDNQVRYALNDKTDSVLDNQISKISVARSEALIDGDEVAVSNYDLQLQSLNKAKMENGIEKDLKNFAISTVAGYANSTQLLDAYNSKISGSATTGSIKIGDVVYASPQEFWKFKRDSYLADNSSDGFFSRYSNELQSNLKIKNSQNALTTEDVRSAAKSFDTLMSRPELQTYVQSINLYKQDTLQTGADLVAKTVYNQYTGSYDLNKTLNDLNSIRSLGVNVDDTYYKILTDAAALKNTQIQNILSTAGQLITNSGLEPGAALDEAIKTGAGQILSPEQLATKSETQIAKESATGMENKSFTGSDTRTTTPASNIQNQNIPPIVPTQTPTPTPTTPTPPVAINREFDLGITDPQVKELQKFLNKLGFTVASAGAGSSGQETEYYGPLTQAAVQKFQKSYGIVSGGDAASTGYGRVGPQTLKKIQELYGK